MYNKEIVVAVDEYINTNPVFWVVGSWDKVFNSY